MKRYLLAAEADKIQDFVFRSSRLQEVMGGSMLLTRFCEEAVQELGANLKSEWDVVVGDGGSFRLWFADPDEAHAFGRELAELYRRVAGGSLTVASQLGEYDSDHSDEFHIANKTASEALQRAKRDARSQQPAIHLPQMAFCASCGVALAIEHATIHERKMYRCDACQTKTDERIAFYVGPERYDSKKESKFVNQFKVEIRKAHESLAWDDKLLWIPTDAVDAIGRLDPRNYVAYLVADGNGMGELFGQCRTDEALRSLSKALTETMNAALAQPVKDLIERSEEIAGKRKFKSEAEPQAIRLRDVLPVVPLILGGDDLFALLPAPYALDFARAFCEVYEELMNPKIQKLALDFKATISAVVVICKSSHPYMLAHDRGHALLQRAKQLAKAHGRSVVDVELILGNEMIAGNGHEGKQPPYASSLRPFWAGGASSNAGIPAAVLVEQRSQLNGLPNKRLNQLDELYWPENLPTDNTDSLKSWNGRLERLLKRIGRQEGDRKRVENALAALGDVSRDSSDIDHWKIVERGAARYRANALPDLLTLWDYAYNLRTPREQYDTGEPVKHTPHEEAR